MSIFRNIAYAAASAALFGALCLAGGLVFPAGTAPIGTAQAAPANADMAGLNFNAGPAINRSNSADMSKTMDLLVQSGASWQRVILSWAQIQPRQGTYQWKSLDNIVSALRARNFNILLTIKGAPCWSRADTSRACSDIAEGNYVGGNHVPDRAALTQFMTDLVTHYRGQVSYYEVWNEPNAAEEIAIPGAANNADALFTAYRDDFLIPAAEAIHKADSAARVVGPAFFMGARWTPATLSQKLQTVFGNGAAQLLDVVSIHVYPPQDMFAFGRAARQAMQDAGIGNRPLWLTEFGVPADGAGGAMTPGSLNAQRDYLVKALNTDAATHVFDKMFWYSFADNGMFSNWRAAKKYGLINADFSPRPALTALQNFTGGSAP